MIADLTKIRFRSWFFACVGVAALVAAPRLEPILFGLEYADIARDVAKELAYEAYPAWVAAHPSDECPRALSELTAYTNHKDTIDPWGSQFLMVCTNRGAIIGSAGEDAVFGTADDIWSNR